MVANNKQFQEDTATTATNTSSIDITTEDETTKLKNGIRRIVVRYLCGACAIQCLAWMEG